MDVQKDIVNKDLVIADVRNQILAVDAELPFKLIDLKTELAHLLRVRGNRKEELSGLRKAIVAFLETLQ